MLAAIFESFKETYENSSMKGLISLKRYTDLANLPGPNASSSKLDIFISASCLVRRIFSIIKLLLLAYFRYDFTIKNYELGDILC